NAADSAPSANRSRSRFGMRNAVMNASSSRPAPNSIAKTCSRTTPSTRLASTAMLTTPARRASCARPPPAASALGAGATAAPLRSASIGPAARYVMRLSGARTRPSGGGDGGGRVGGGQHHREGGATPDGALHRDLAVHQAGEAAGERQAEADALLRSIARPE